MEGGTCNNKIDLGANLDDAHSLIDSNGKLKMLCWNYQGISNKIVNLSRLASLKQSDVICIAENWLAESEADSIIIPSFKTAHFFRHVKLMGGTVIVIREDYEFT